MKKEGIIFALSGPICAGKTEVALYLHNCHGFELMNIKKHFLEKTSKESTKGVDFYKQSNSEFVTQIFLDGVKEAK